MTRTDDSPVPDYRALLSLEGRVFLVVGAGQGNGRQTAHALGQAGAQVVCVDLEPDLAAEVAAEVGGLAVTADVRRAEEVEAAVRTAVKVHGRLDGVADIVGLTRWGPLVESLEEDWDWTFDIVLRHAYHLVRFAAPPMVAAGGGSMVFTASISGLTSAPGHAAYGAAKAAMLSLVRTAAVELRPANVRVNAVAPGGIATPRLLAKYGVRAEEVADGSLEKYARTSDIAAAILFLSSPLAGHITGQALVVDGGGLLRTTLNPPWRQQRA